MCHDVITICVELWRTVFGETVRMKGRGYGLEGDIREQTDHS